MNQQNNGLIYGLSYFTALPFRVEKFEADKNFYQGVIKSLPLSGFILAICTIIFYKILPFTPLYSAFLSSIFYIFLYGMLHLEAVADTIDGYYASLSSKDIYKVMHEPQIGALGAIGTFAFTLLNIGAITYILYQEKYIVLIIALTLSRISIWFALEKEFHPKSTFIISLKENYIQNHLLDICLFFLRYFTHKVLDKFQRQFGFLNGDILGFVIVINEILLLNIGLILF